MCIYIRRVPLDSGHLLYFTSRCGLAVLSLSSLEIHYTVRQLTTSLNNMALSAVETLLYLPFKAQWLLYIPSA